MMQGIPSRVRLLAGFVRLQTPSVPVCSLAIAGIFPSWRIDASDHSRLDESMHEDPYEALLWP